jgi:hypothetical protein
MWNNPFTALKLLNINLNYEIQQSTAHKITLLSRVGWLQNFCSSPELQLLQKYVVSYNYCYFWTKVVRYWLQLLL